MSFNQTVCPLSASAQGYPPLPPHITHHRNIHTVPKSRDQEVFVQASHEWKGAPYQGEEERSDASIVYDDR
ncbi:hypothetical protein M378DRAFT_167329 [Amanita muscaria Koide BX008]|uniref:Uncharacterized protein n=1 Tax=Amanita muscaria (strain Koide BX008) TaxID=946122 RepID=A0A0C2T3R1_AMAMK|nr:hypothetical protein M378DRAFT_167329 [Amanita muscaria Koide BX008]